MIIVIVVDRTLAKRWLTRLVRVLQPALQAAANCLKRLNAE